MIALIKNEIYKIFKLKKTYIFMGVTLVMMLLNYMSIMILKTTAKNDQSTKGLEDLVGGMSGQNFPLQMLNSMSTIICIYIIVLLADIITDEYRNGTLKLSLLRPVLRINLLFSKVAGLLAGILSLQIFTLVVSYILGTLFFGWGDMLKMTTTELANGQLVTKTIELTTAHGIWFTIGSYFLEILPFLAFGMIVFLISIIFSSMGATIGASLGIWIVLQFISQLINDAKPYIINTYYTFYYEFAKEPDWKKIVTGFCVIAVYLIVPFLAGVFVFKKRDILM